MSFSRDKKEEQVFMPTCSSFLNAPCLATVRSIPETYLFISVLGVMPTILPILSKVWARETNSLYV